MLFPGWRAFFCRNRVITCQKMLLLISQCFMYPVKICEVLETCMFLCASHPNLNFSSKQEIQRDISVLICQITCKPVLVFVTSCWLKYESSSYSYSIQKWFVSSYRTSVALWRFLDLSCSLSTRLRVAHRQ